MPDVSRPIALPVFMGGIPQTLTTMPRWICWRYERTAATNPEKQWTKVPINAKTGGAASSTNAKTWTTFEQSLAYYQKGLVDGLGITLGDGLMGIDLDKGRDPESGDLAPWVLEIVKRIDSYTEISPSGLGVHILCFARWPDTGRKQGQIEAYAEGRYFTVTGVHVEGTPATVERRDEVILQWHAEVFKSVVRDTGEPQIPSGKLCRECSAEFTAKYPHEPFMLHATATPPFLKFEALIEINVKFRLSWQHKRKDFQASGDATASRYDESIAMITMSVGWGTQEIIDTLIAHRNKYGDDLKFERGHDYYARTLAYAYRQIYGEKAQELVDEYSLSREAQNGQPEQVADEQRAELLESLSRIYGVKILHIIKYNQTPRQYKLETELGDVLIGRIGALRAQKTFLDALADATSRDYIAVGTAIWHKRVQIMLDVAVEVDTGGDATDHGHAMTMLVHYLESHIPVRLKDDPDIWIAKKPLIREETVIIFGEPWRRWITRVYGDRPTSQEAGRWLREVGCLPTVKGFQRAETGGWTTRQVWEVPAKVMDLVSAIEGRSN